MKHLTFHLVIGSGEIFNLQDFAFALLREPLRLRRAAVPFFCRRRRRSDGDPEFFVYTNDGRQETRSRFITRILVFARD